MPEVKFADVDGKEITLLDIGDEFPVPTFCHPTTESHFAKLSETHCRDDDIFLCAFPKSGTHWIWEIINMLLKGKAETVQDSKISMMLEVPQCKETLDAAPSPRVINTHMRFRHLPKQAVGKKCKIVFVLRNPKDVSVSHFHHVCGLFMAYRYSGTWEHFLPLWLDGKVDYGSWFDYNLDWEKAIKDNADFPILVLHYEDVKENTVAEVQKLAQFLGVQYGDTLYNAISDKCHIDNMRKNKASFETPAAAKWDETQISYSFFRKGVVGDWKNHFTVSQNEMFDARYEQKMNESKWRVRYEI